MAGERLAFPIAYHAAGTFDHRHQRHEVERLERGFDDEIAMPRGQEAVLITVAAKSPEHGLAAERVVTRPILRRKEIRRRRVDLRIFQIDGAAYSGRFFVERR